MSIQTEITRIITDRNTIRTKLTALGLATGTDSLDALATAISNMANRGTPDAEVKEGESYSIQAGYYQGGTVRGVAGGGSYNLQPKTATPTKQQQSITPDAGYYGISEVTVGAIPDNYQDVSSVTAVAANVLATKTFVPANGTLTAGTMPNNGAVSATLDTTTTSYTIPEGYHSGSGSVSIVTEEKTATPTMSSQDITPTSGKVLEKVVVDPIPKNYVNLDYFTNTDALAGNILADKMAYAFNRVDGFTEIVGTMPNNGAQSGTLDTTTTTKTIPAGYTSGGVVSVASEAKTATPSTSQQVIKGTGNKYLTQVTVSAIPARYVDSSTVDAVAGNVLSGKKAVVKTGTATYAVVSGTMADNGAISGTIDGLTATSYAVPAGYTSGGTVSLTSDIEDALAAI